MLQITSTSSMQFIPFGKENGRATRALLKEIARQAGHDLSLEGISPRAWNDGSITGFQKGDHKPLARVIGAAFVSPELERSPRQILDRIEEARQAQLSTPELLQKLAQGRQQRAQQQTVSGAEVRAKLAEAQKPGHKVSNPVDKPHEIRSPSAPHPPGPRRRG